MSLRLLSPQPYFFAPTDSTTAFCSAMSVDIYHRVFWIVRMFFGAMRLSGTRIAAFFYHVTHIIRMRSNKQMPWPYAQAVITSMQNTKSTGDISESEHPRKPMRLDQFARSVGSTSDTEAAIPIRRPTPQPAWASSINQREKSLFNVHVYTIAVVSGGLE